MFEIVKKTLQMQTSLSAAELQQHLLFLYVNTMLVGTGIRQQCLFLSFSFIFVRLFILFRLYCCYCIVLILLKVYAVAVAVATCCYYCVLVVRRFHSVEFRWQKSFFL